MKMQINFLIVSPDKFNFIYGWLLSPFKEIILIRFNLLFLFVIWDIFNLTLAWNIRAKECKQHNSFQDFIVRLLEILGFTLIYIFSPNIYGILYTIEILKLVYMLLYIGLEYCIWRFLISIKTLDFSRKSMIDPW